MDLPDRSTLLLDTDGLVERRGESLNAGLTRLRQHAAALVREPLPMLCDELLAERYPDDVALLALRLPPARHQRLSSAASATGWGPGARRWQFRALTRFAHPRGPDVHGAMPYSTTTGCAGHATSRRKPWSMRR
ncbi:SpoIIE family protein phosphatase [Streptomyces sp. NPDC006739]|uniref:SpoIIE family protein phosphatase n=1 Tax=Streptomyces sp. NPDC006739 TaxID=3364763 RepID=UPI00369465E6